ncbi:MAG: DUF3313 domain-containing protein [Pseudomonadota bacterium]
MKRWDLGSGKGVLVMALGLLLLTACATTTPPQSGFLRDYSKLKPDPEDESLLWYEEPNVDWKRYKKLMIDQVVVFYHPEAKNRQIEPDVLKELTDYFRNVVIEKVQDAYPVVDKPGPDVLRIRAAITDLVPANPFVNVVTTAGVGVPVDMGGAAMEAEFLDSITNEPLGAVVDMKKGTPVDINMLKGFTTWGYAKGAFREWAELLRESLGYVEKKGK